MKLMFKWIPRLIFFAIVAFVIFGAVTWLVNKASEPPSIDDAPWVIQTYSNDEHRIPSRVYYANDMKILEDGTPVIIDYWRYDGKKYRHEKGEKPFPVDDYGSIGITRREQ